MWRDREKTWRYNDEATFTHPASCREFIEQDKYSEVLPVYTYGRCPFCQESIQAKFDTYSLSHFDTYAPSPIYGLPHHVGDDLLRNFYESISCEHYLGQANFLNFHGYKPPKGKRIRTYGEIPFVPEYLFDSRYKERLENIDIQVVLHALPICNILEQQFVPTITIFILTYFIDKRDVFIQGYRKRRGETDDGRLHLIPYKTSTYSTSILSSLNQKGYLSWLDYTQPDELPLRTDSLPSIYKNIQGRVGYRMIKG